MMVLYSSFPRADSGPRGLNAVLRIKVILLNPFPPVLRHFSKSRGASVRPFPWFESTCACARFSIWHFPDCFSIMRCVLPRLPSANGVFSDMGACNSKRTSFRAGTAGAFRVAACDVTRTPPAPVGGGARDRADVRTGRRKRGRMRPWKGSSEGGKPSGVCRCATFAEKLPVFLLFTGTFVPKLALFSSCCAFSRDKSRGSTDKRGRKRTRKRENVHSRRQKLVVSPFSCKFAAEVPAPHSHFSLACGGLQSTP